MPAGGAPIVGRQAIGGFFGDLIGNGFSDHKIAIESVDEKGPICRVGKWALTGPGDGSGAARRQLGECA